MMSENYWNKTVCVYALCNDSEMRLTTQTAMLGYTCSQQYGNTIQYMYQTCSKSIICLVLVNFNSCNNAMQSAIIQILLNKDIKKHRITSQCFIDKSLYIFFNYHPITVVRVYFFPTTR